MSYRRQVKATLSLHDVFDTDLPPANRTQANMWKALYFEMRQEVRNANKGINRLKRKLSEVTK